MVFYDPPSGWRYGFPREYAPLPNESVADTLVRDGYPAAKVAFAAKYCRFFDSTPPTSQETR